MKLRHWRFDLQLRHTWAIATDVGGGGSGGKSVYPVVFVELSDRDGRVGIGEAAPSSQYQESHATVTEFLDRVDPRRLCFDDIPGSMDYLASLAPGRYPAKCALNLALLDGAAKAAGVPVHRFLGLDFHEGRHLTSFTIGIDTPEMIGRKVAEAAAYPVLKMKLGGPQDRENFAALRRAAPGKTVRVDANAGWSTREEALDRIEWLAADGHVEFVEQPMQPGLPDADWEWLKARSPLPLFGDELYQGASDADRCARCVHGVNVKLVKTGGITGAHAALTAARARGLRTMIGCMIESSVLISAGAHLAALADHLDLDGNVLITNDPFTGVRNESGVMAFAGVEPPTGLQVAPRRVRADACEQIPEGEPAAVR